MSGEILFVDTVVVDAALTAALRVAGYTQRHVPGEAAALAAAMQTKPLLAVVDATGSGGAVELTRLLCHRWSSCAVVILVVSLAVLAGVLHPASTRALAAGEEPEQ